ncbi:hypothetical protein OWM54_05885 [Myxococcus sp. MISCRS1]|uniref:hypothetical protein n=1 Tax=Myxococcus TaxID=32 RepID=UPI001CC14989|nr:MULTISPECIES: hypothetical protein [unclassified Myxococcus]MBZ4397052.1 hypothetical protein [Myxococcus sp. AS-1-15]MBZ4408222.1 hypothetical protein [Myxococcus sp. XM-1-1-1]MCY0996664.1 hypothetical protein [Myxococcus sp. MISCRS1]BDT33319.1 hypothetical protein MFMH1_29880 [Myxococcus sp. MH1]
MAVGGVGRGGGKGRAGGAKGPSSAAPAGGAFGARVDKAESLVGVSGLVGSSNVQGPQAADPVAAQAMAIARGLKNGGFKSKEEATRALVAEVLKEKLRMKSSSLTTKIADALQDDPRLNQVLERLWSKAE